MESARFDALAQAWSGATSRRSIGRLLTTSLLLGLVARTEHDTTAAKKKPKKPKKPKKKDGECPQGQKKDTYGICGVPPDNCLTVGALCSGEAMTCCSEDCRLLDDEGQYRCIPGKARCLVDYGCAGGYVCRGWRCVPPL